VLVKNLITLLGGLDPNSPILVPGFPGHRNIVDDWKLLQEKPIPIRVAEFGGVRTKAYLSPIPINARITTEVPSFSAVMLASGAEELLSLYRVNTGSQLFTPKDTESIEPSIKSLKRVLRDW